MRAVTAGLIAAILAWLAIEATSRGATIEGRYPSALPWLLVVGAIAIKKRRRTMQW